VCLCADFLSLTARFESFDASLPVFDQSLFVDGMSIGTASLDAAGTATVTVPGVAPGMHTLVGQYLGDTNTAFAGSTSAAAYIFAQ